MNVEVTQEFAEELFSEAAQHFGEIRLDVRLGYSGREMYGGNCLGVVTNKVVGLMVAVGLVLGDQWQDGGHQVNDIDRLIDAMMHARTDSMGLDTIVYWPNIKVVG